MGQPTPTTYAPDSKTSLKNSSSTTTPASVSPADAKPAAPAAAKTPSTVAAPGGKGQAQVSWRADGTYQMVRTPAATASGNSAGTSVKSSTSTVGSTTRGQSSSTSVVQYEKLRSRYAANEITHADRIGRALTDDQLHRSASFLSQEQLAVGRTYTIWGKDGRPCTLLQTRGQLNDVDGIFEYLINKNGQVTHQRFVEGGAYTGSTNQKVRKGGYQK